MALKLSTTNLDEIPEGLREHYKEKDGEPGTFVAQFDPPLPDATALRKTLDTERERARNLDKKLALYNGMDPEKYKELEAIDGWMR